MTDYILIKEMERVSLDRWENEGGKSLPVRADVSGQISSGFGKPEKNDSQILRDANSKVAG